MGKYKILVQYETGSSSHKETTEDYLDLEWDNLDVAKENLKAIKEHYKMYNSIEMSYGSQVSDQELFEENSKNWWFVKDTKNKLFVDFSRKGNGSKNTWSIVENTPENLKKYSGYPHELRYDSVSTSHSMLLKADNGNLMRHVNFWCGYFERLLGAEIKISKDLDMEFSL